MLNQEFSRTFESLDIVRMDRVWSQQEYVTCIHPGWTLRVGWPSVRDSWVLIFNDAFSMKFDLTEIQVQVAGDMASGHCHLDPRRWHRRDDQESRGL